METISWAPSGTSVPVIETGSTLTRRGTPRLRVTGARASSPESRYSLRR